ncbi:protein FAM200C-like [Oratosquilla oratoria]|uniref:protein FAM200C-like n=1 Tax=Oratosquilla oratoria TaxID=337810 RepID=UPI003F776D28
MPQCMICYKTLSNDGMRPTLLERHLRTAHPVLADKPKAFFETKKRTPKQAKLDDTELVLGKDSANKLSQISLSNDTVKGRVNELSQDIKVQTLDQVRASPVFAIQCDETTDIAQCSQLLITLPAEIRDVLNVAIKVVNFIKAGALNSRLFKLLCKEMESEHEALLFHTNKTDIQDKLQLEGFLLTLAYLVDIFDELNAVNLKLQGKEMNIIMHHDIIRAFMAKLDLWKCRIQQGNTAMFRTLDSALGHSNLDSVLKKQIITHLSDLKAEFIRYFPDIDKRKAWKFIRNPFQCEVADVAYDIQEEFLELKFNSTAQDDFGDLDLEAFWVKYLPVYPLTSHHALRVLTMFGSTYLCEAAFSMLVAIKTKYRNRLNVEGDLRCALSSIQPRIQDLVAKKQCQISH